MVMNRETTPEQRLDLVVCDQQSYPAAEQYYQNGHYHHDHPGVIRPIPGRPGGGGGGGGGRDQNGPPPVPGPKPVLNYLKNDQYNNTGLNNGFNNGYNGQGHYSIEFFWLQFWLENTQLAIPFDSETFLNNQFFEFFSV